MFRLSSLFKYQVYIEDGFQLSTMFVLLGLHILCILVFANACQFYSLFFAILIGSHFVCQKWKGSRMFIFLYGTDFSI